MKYDFSGWATRNGLKCSDGRTIMRDAFKDNDGQTVPLVWNHQHNEPYNVLGHAVLENRNEGVYAYCSFNDTEQGNNAKALVEHGDVKSLSIYANKLKQNGGNVLHGAIREVSLVLAGANPGAYIDTILEHGDDADDAAVICTGENIELYHADCGGKTVGEILDSLTEEQKTEYEANHEDYYVLPGEADGDERYFKKVVMDNGVFTQGSTGEFDTLISVGNEKGITAHGLADGKYILVETKAPNGYNELAEDIYFEINRLTEDEEQLKTTDKSLIWFREISDNYDDTDPETAVINQNACISIDVYNYRGLTLPSTGGIGILLFVIVGTVLMGTVIIIAINRRKMEENF